MVASSEDLETIWEVDDVLWALIDAILLAAYPRKSTGRPRIDFRQALNGIIYRLRSGCQWNHLPKEFGDDSSIHRWFQRWVDDGIFEKIWATLIEHCNALGAVEWKWQAADSALGKARFGGTRLAPTPRIAAKRARRKTFLSKARVVRSPR
jgi:putative transposase